MPTFQRNNDILTTVAIENIATKSAEEIAKTAFENVILDLNLNDHQPITPNGSGVVLVFHMPDGIRYGLGAMRENPELKDEKTDQGTSYPKQAQTAIGGTLFDATKPLLTSMIGAVKYKFFADKDLGSDALEAQQAVSRLINSIEDPKGWAQDICIQTNQAWEMNYLTAIKHIQCTEQDLDSLEKSFETIFKVAREKGEEARRLSDFKRYRLVETVKNLSKEDASLEELPKAQKAFQANATVIFNDLAMLTFKDNGNFKPKNQPSNLAQLSLVSELQKAEKEEFAPSFAI
ncbi:MAG: hypothetical protein HKM04_10315 [Legionellales bacterium]|nr:hypothetical protein [Legionellales bacterium]